MNRPSQLIYGVDDKPNFSTLVLLGLQYVVVISAYLLLPVIVMQQAHIDSKLAAGVISTAMLVTGVTAILQVFRKGLIGSGYLILSSANAVYLAPSIIAIQIGGLPLVLGMTLFAGILQAILAPFFKHLQKFFPAEIGGLVMALIGVETGMIGINDFIAIFSLPVAHPVLPVIISIFTLIVILVMTLWGSQFFRLYALILVLILGYFLIYITGCMSTDAIMQIKQASWFALPTFPTFSVGLSFDSSLIFPFAIVSVACSIKISGAVTAHQRLNDANWSRPEMKSISRGSFVDSLGSIFCGLLGSFGQNISSSALGLSLSTWVGCRRIAYTFAAIFWFLSFSPKFALILVSTPTPVVAVILIFLAATLLVAGFKTIIPRMTVSHRAVVIGISFMLGISRDIYPQTYEHLPNILQTLAGSSIALATISAIIFNFIALLSIDNSKIARIMVNGDALGLQNGMQFLESLKKDWHLPHVLFDDAKEAFSRLMDFFMAKNLTKQLITVDVGLTRSQLDFVVSYEGSLIKPINQKSKGNSEANDVVFIPLASHVSSSKDGGISSLQISFDY